MYQPYSPDLATRESKKYKKTISVSPNIMPISEKDGLVPLDDKDRDVVELGHIL